MSSILASAGVFAIVLALFAAIFVARRRGVGFTTVTLGALAAGVAIGVAFPGHAAWVKPIGTVYVGLLNAIVAPLIVVSILASVTSFGSLAKLRGIGLRSVGWLVVTTVLAGLLALGLGLIFGVGRGANLSIDGIDATGVQGQLTSIADVITGFFPSNLVADFSDNRILPIIVATAAVAIAYVLVADKNPALTRPFKSLIDAVKLIVFKAVEWVIALTPYAVLALVVSATAGGVNRGGLAWALLGLLLVAVVALALDTWAINYVLLRAFARVRPGIFFRKIAPAQLVAFSTQSSVGTLPVTTQVLTRGIGVSEEVAGFAAPLGTTIGMPGCAGIWPILVAIFAIHGLGLTYGVGDYALLVATGLLISLGTAGVPGTATITSASVLAALGLPLEVVLLVVPISAIADTARTASNVTAAAVAATIVAREEGALNDSVFSSTKTYANTAQAARLDDAAPSGSCAPRNTSGAAMDPRTPDDAAPSTIPAGADREDQTP